MATIKDVAKLAKVSVGTVSNMLNGKETVSDEKYIKIKRAMKELSYRPNYMAQNLKTQKSKIIGIILPSLEEPYNDIYEGIVDRLDIKDYITVLKLTHNNIVLENQFLTQLSGMGALGIIIVPCDCGNLQKYREIENSGITFVFVERKLNGSGFSNIIFENKKLVLNITESIVEKMQDAIVKVFVGKQEFTSEADCKEGYLMLRPEREEDITVIKETGKEAVFDHIYKVIAEYDTLPDCVITSSLEMGKILLEVCNVLKYKLYIHALTGEKWYTTDLYQNMMLYGRNAILMGKSAAKLLEGLMSNKHLAENQTIYMQAKNIYEQAKIRKLTVQRETIRILAFQCDATNALEKLSHGFSNETGVKFEFDKKGYTELRSEIKKQIDTGACEYDIIMMDIPWIRGILAKDYLANIVDRAKEDGLLKLYPSGLRSAFYKGDLGVHIMPIIATIQVIMYRKDIFADLDIKSKFRKNYGFELSTPKTWTNFNIISEFFDRKCNPDSPFEYGTAATSLEPVGLINEFLPRQWAFRGAIIDQWGKLAMDSEENIRALDNLVTTFEHAPKEAESYFWDEIFEMLIKGQIPMAHGFASHYQPGNHSKIGDTYEKYIAGISLPRSKTMLGGWALGINKHSSKIAECYEFIKWNLSDKTTIANMRLCGCMPTVTVLKDETLKGTYQWLDLVDEKFNFGGLREEIYDINRKVIDLEIVDQILSAGIKKAIHKEMDSHHALKEIQDNLSRILKAE